MRTTLKRAIGRGAVNGNGRAVLPPAVELGGADLPQEITVYRQPPRQRSVASIVATILGWLLVAVVTAAVGLAGGTYLYFHESVNAIAAHTPALKIAQERLDIALPDAPAIALVVGVDERKKGVDAAADDGPGRSDTLLLLRADPQQQALSMLSFPRDLSVPIVCPDKPTFTGRINEAFSSCGPRGALETVKSLTGLPINYLVTVNFVGFVKLVAQVGGVWMDVDRRYFNPPNSGYAAIDLHPGYQRLSGRQALDFVRFRHTDSDVYRLARQQRFIHALKQALTTSFSVEKLLKITGVVRNNLEVAGKGFGGNTVKKWGLFAFQLPSGRVFQTRIDPSCYVDLPNFLVGASPECIDRAVQQFSRPDVNAPERATDTALGRKPKLRAPAPGRTSIVVLNGNGVPGAAADASYQLSQQGYQTVEPANGALANAPRQDYPRTKIYFDDSRPAAKRAAAKLVQLFGGAQQVDTGAMPVAIQPLAGSAMLAVVLGTSFGGNISAPADDTPQREPPAVVKNPDATAASVHEAQRKVRFPLVVPTVLEHTSRLSSEEGVRVYQTGGHRTVRLTFVTGASEYWGIQMVPWRSAPALKGANDTVTIKGRTYALYYSGSKLDMVVLRVGPTTYWVTNTLLGSLSNETMLAIAKGLRPLKGR
jgi:LCP family protein required for cell wall assembly